MGVQEEFEKDLLDCDAISSFLKSVESEGLINIQTTSTLITKAGKEAKILLGSREKEISPRVTPSLIEDTISLDVESVVAWEDGPSMESLSENEGDPDPVINRKTPNTIDPVDTEGAVSLKRESAVDFREGASKRTIARIEKKVAIRLSIAGV